jgi:hypothetical protein
VSGAAADITAINAAPAGGYVRFYTAGTNGADEAVGLDKIFTNTGTLFGIDAAVYSLWQANVFPVGGALTLAKIQEGVAIAAQRGLSEDVSLYVNPTVWQDLSSEQVAFRMFDSSYSAKKAANGFEALEFYSQNGKITVYAHKYVKEGEAFFAQFVLVAQKSASIFQVQITVKCSFRTRQPPDSHSACTQHNRYWLRNQLLVLSSQESSK